MKNQIYKLRSWFEQLSLRERILFTLLVWALTYAAFSLLLLRPLNNQRTVYIDKIKEANNQINILQLQLDAIDKIADSPLYIEWKTQHDAYEKMQQRYKTLLTNFSSTNWHNVIKSVIASHPNITLSHIENTEETPLSPGTTGNEAGIYKQGLTFVVYGDYFNLIKYLEQLEKALPNVHWDTLKYEVVSYPTAKITIGFSIFYDKTVKN